MKKLAYFASLTAAIFFQTALSQDVTRSGSPAPHDRRAEELLRSGPSETSGLESQVVGSVPLESFPSTLIQGHLRGREVVLAPGGKIAVHVHDVRPAIVYVLEGEMVEHRNDSETSLVRRQGDIYLEGPGVVPGWRTSPRFP